MALTFRVVSAAGPCGGLSIVPTTAVAWSDEDLEGLGRLGLGRHIMGFWASKFLPGGREQFSR